MALSPVSHEAEQSALEAFLSEINNPNTKATSITKFSTIGADKIASRQYAELRQPVQGFISEGVTLFVGASKIGKSWLVLDLCMCVAQGLPFLGRPTLKGTVLYMALEDSEQRIKDRMEKISLDACGNLQLIFDVPLVGDDFCDKLDNWITQNSDACLIVIDTLQMIRGPISGSKQIYAADYDFIRKIKHIAKNHHISIVLVHHTNKMQKVDDVYDKTSGSVGLMGAADATILMCRDRTKEAATISYTGRDICGRDFVVRLTNHRWTISENDNTINSYESDVVSFARSIIKENPMGIKMTYADVLNKANSSGFSIGINSKAFIKNASNASEHLKKAYGIVLKTSERVKNCRGISLYKVNSTDCTDRT